MVQDVQPVALSRRQLLCAIENQEKGNYKVYLDAGDYAGDCIIKFNMSYEDDAELNKWFNTADFRPPHF